MRYIADTSYLIDLINGSSEAVKLAEEFDSLDERLGLSVISVEEYLRGIIYLYLDNTLKLKKKLIEAKSDLSPFEILPVTFDIASKAAEIDATLVRKGEMLSLTDIFIGATALYHNLILVTRNVKHFSRIRNLKIKSYRINRQKAPHL